MIAIIDCNSFYCSCERLFRPSLDDKPVVVLSNNDGCIVSRTDEAKALGVAMAGPYFLAKPTIEKYGVATFSSNYNLYGDLSWRVMETLRILLGEKNIEVYSVDEAFLDLSEFKHTNLYEEGLRIKNVVETWTGIKVSIGIAPTKVLSKVANRLCKKNKEATKGVMVLDTPAKISEALQATPVSDVWGIGRQYALKLKEMNAVYTAYDLSKKSAAWAHKNLGGVVGTRMISELNGIPAIEVAKEQLTQKKMIACTRMFGKTISTITEVKQAVATYASRAAEKLRRQGSAATVVSVFVLTREPSNNGRFRHGNTYSHYTVLPIATSATNELIKHAMALVDVLYDASKQYKKAGVILSGFVPDATIQANLFVAPQQNNQRKLMSTMDNINFALRNDVVQFAATGTKRNWKMRVEMRSPRYTTRWNELFEVK